MSRPEQPEYILLEASGVAEPSGIALTFMDDGLRDRIRLDSIMCVVDAEQVFAVPEMMELKLRQVAFADMLILNKVDLVTRRRSSGSRHGSTTGSTATGSSRHPAEMCLWRSCCRSAGSTPPDSTGAPSPDQPDHPHACDGPDCEHHAHDDRHDHSQVFKTWSYETDQPLSLEALRESASKLPASVYRCKGVVHTVEEPDRRAILQVVGKRVDIAVEEEWNGRERSTSIIAIGAHDGVDGPALREAFDRCREAAAHRVEGDGVPC